MLKCSTIIRLDLRVLCYSLRNLVGTRQVKQHIRMFHLNRTARDYRAENKGRQKQGRDSRIIILLLYFQIHMNLIT